MFASRAQSLVLVLFRKNPKISVRKLSGASQETGFISEVSGNQEPLNDASPEKGLQWKSWIFDFFLRHRDIRRVKEFLGAAGFSPDSVSLERYLRYLRKAGLVQDVIDVFMKLRSVGSCPPLVIWNLVLKVCVKDKRTEHVWILYQDMTESGVSADANTIECLIRAFCIEGKPDEGYKLLRQVLEDGLEVTTPIFNRLISAFARDANFAKVSQVLHLMIASNHTPSIDTYHEILKGLCNKRMLPETLRIFNNLKDRGYILNMPVYTTVLYGMCKAGRMDDAKKLWSEMNSKFRPSAYTYNVLMNGYLQSGMLEEANKLYKEMIDAKCSDVVTCNLMITRLCLQGKVNEALQFFQEMPKKGFIHDLISYNNLISGLCKHGRAEDGRKILKQLLECSLNPSALSYAPIVENFCMTGNFQEATELWSEMRDRGLDPAARTYSCFIYGLFKEGRIEEGAEWLATMLKNKHKPHWQTFRRLFDHLLHSNRLDDCLIVLDIFLRIGFHLKVEACHFLVEKLCKGSSASVRERLIEIIEVK